VRTLPASVAITAVLRSFGVALRSQPIDAQAARQPFVNFSLGLKAPDVPNFGSGIVSLDLPSPSAMRLNLKVTRGDLLMGLIMPIFGIGASRGPRFRLHRPYNHRPGAKADHYRFGPIDLKPSPDYAPVIAELQAAGTTTLRGIAAELNNRVIPTATGTWHAAQVSRLLARM
jgi:hypothetical protein